jgi:threonine dehydrogenase-like Zn-dependent dehydrogenase
MIYCCRKGGTLSIPGVYAGLVDKFPYGAAFGKGLTLKGGQTHVHRYLPDLLQFVIDGKIDPSFVISHQMSLEDGPEAYDMFLHKRDGCTKVVLHPGRRPEEFEDRTRRQQTQEASS